MATVTLRARGRLPAADCWERYAQPDLWNTWAPQIRRVETSAERIVAGARGRVVAIGGIAVRFTVEEVDEPGRTWSWRASFGPIRMRLAHGVTSDADDADDTDDTGVTSDTDDTCVTSDTAGSHTWLRVTGPLPVVLGYAPVAALALRRLVTP